jgi:Chaperone of endosialidase
VCYYNTTTFELSYNTGASSILIKKDIKPIVFNSNILNELSDIQLVDFHFKDQSTDDPKTTGFIAEHISSLSNFQNCIVNVPIIQIGEETFENIPGIDYQTMSLMLYPIVKLLASSISDLKREIVTIRQDNEKLAEKIHQLTTVIIKR